MTNAASQTPFASSEDEMPMGCARPQGVSSSLDTNGTRQDSPGIKNRHYLNTATTAQKPQAMLTENALAKLGELV